MVRGALSVSVCHEVQSWSCITTASEKVLLGVSDCPYCAIGHDANRQRIWKLEEMDADHVTAWSRGGETSMENCQMLCKMHNRAKGNK